MAQRQKSTADRPCDYPRCPAIVVDGYLYCPVHRQHPQKLIERRPPRVKARPGDRNVADWLPLNH